MPRSMTLQDLEQAREFYLPKARIDYRGPAPDWSDLDCRGCWSALRPGQPSVDAATGAFHEECWDIVARPEEKREYCEDCHTELPFHSRLCSTNS